MRCVGDMRRHTTIYIYIYITAYVWLTSGGPKSHYRPLSLFARNNYTLEELAFTCSPPEPHRETGEKAQKGEQVKHESHSAGSSSLQKKEETSPAMAPM